MKPSRVDSQRMIHFITHSAAVVILASYSAALISFLTVETVNLPFTTIDGLVRDNTYKLGVQSGSSDLFLLEVINIFKSR